MKKESLGLKFSTRQASGILKLRQEGEIPIENFCKLPVSQIQTAEGFEEKVFNSQKKDNIVTSFQESSNSSNGMS